MDYFCLKVKKNPWKITAKNKGYKDIKMLLVIFVILYIAWQTYKGYHVGFSKRIVNLIFAGLVFMLAIMMQNPVGDLIYTQFVQGQAGDSSLVLHACRFGAFFALFFILKQISKIFKAWLPAQETKTGFTATLDHMAGAIVSFVASYFFMYVVLSILNSVGVSQLSQLISDSQLLSFIVNDTPGLSTGVFKTLFSVSRTTA